jgi:hypothetical protein
MDHEMKIAREVDCLALTIMCHAGFNMRHDPFAFWKRNIEGRENWLRIVKGRHAHTPTYTRAVCS